MEPCNKFEIVGLKSRQHSEDYYKGYDAAEKNYIRILNKIRSKIEQLPINARTNWDGCCPDIDYPEIEYVDVSKDKLLSIIDKYIAESEGIAL